MVQRGAGIRRSEIEVLGFGCSVRMKYVYPSYDQGLNDKNVSLYKQ
jgi:hypothetical protein